MIQRLAVCLGALLLSLSAYGASSPVGYWQVKGDSGKAESMVEIVEKDNVLKGVVVKTFGASPDARCTACQGALKNKPLQGLTILWGLKLSGDSWVDGQVLAPKTGEAYHCELSMPNKDTVNIIVKKGLFSKTKVWTRVSKGDSSGG